MCDACTRRACGSCPRTNCECYAAFAAWQAYHAATIRPVSKGKDQWSPETAADPPHSAYTGRHERYLDYKLGPKGIRQKSP